MCIELIIVNPGNLGTGIIQAQGRIVHYDTLVPELFRTNRSTWQANMSDQSTYEVKQFSHRVYFEFGTK